MVPLHPIGMQRSVEYDNHKNLHPIRDASLQDARECIILFSTERGIPIGMPLMNKKYRYIFICNHLNS